MAPLRCVRGERRRVCPPRRELQPAQRAHHSEPYPVYVRLRQHSPVHRSVILGSWILSRYADVLAVARDHERFSNDPRWRNAAASLLPPAPDDYSILLVEASAVIAAAAA